VPGARSRQPPPALRARETGLKDQITALDAQAADRDAYLRLAGDLEGFLAIDDRLDPMKCVPDFAVATRPMRRQIARVAAIKLETTRLREESIQKRLMDEELKTASTIL